MDRRHALAVDFLASAPAAAARALEEQDVSSAAAFLSEVPAHLAAPIVGAMAAVTAADCLALIEPERAAAVIREMRAQDATASLRLIGRAARDRILGGLPRHLAEDFTSLLAYPPASVGAWMDPKMPSIVRERTTSDCLAMVKSRKAPTGSEIIVVDQDGAYSGIVTLAALVTATPQTPLSRLSNGAVTPLSALAPLAAYADLGDWDKYLTLPVVNRDRKVVGGLSRADLRKGLADARSRVHAGGAQTIAGDLLGAFAATSRELIYLLVNVEADTVHDGGRRDERQR